MESVAKRQVREFDDKCFCGGPAAAIPSVRDRPAETWGTTAPCPPSPPSPYRHPAPSAPFLTSSGQIADLVVVAERFCDRFGVLEDPFTEAPCSDRDQWCQALHDGGHDLDVSAHALEVRCVESSVGFVYEPILVEVSVFHCESCASISFFASSSASHVGRQMTLVPRSRCSAVSRMHSSMVLRGRLDPLGAGRPSISPSLSYLRSNAVLSVSRRPVLRDAAVMPPPFSSLRRIRSGAGVSPLVGEARLNHKVRFRLT